MPTPALARLGAWIAGLRSADIPEASLLAARYQVLNMLAAVHAAARTHEPRTITGGVAGFAGPGRSTVLAGGARTGPVDAALANAATSMTQDFDDIVWMGHTCHSAVFAPLAVAEHEGAGSRELLEAVVIANEIGGRLGASCFLGPLNGQMVTHIHLVGAAAATARLLGLDAERTTHALAISLAQPTMALQPGFLAPTSKLLAAATPTAIGVQAAYFARAGMTGAAEILEDRRGFWRRFSYLPLPFMLEGLGEFWAVQTLTIKTYPGCHFFQTACSSIEEILGRTGPLRPEQVRAVQIDTTKLACEVTRFGGEYAGDGTVTHVNVNFDLTTTAAVQLHAGRLTGGEIEADWLRRESPAIRRWRELVSVRHDPALTAEVLGAARAVSAGRSALAALTPGAVLNLVRRYREEYASTLITPAELLGWLKVAITPRQRRPPPVAGAPVPLPFPARVTVEMTGGRRERAELSLPVGSFAAPTAARALEAKVLAESGATLGTTRARALLDAGLALPATSVARLVELATVLPPARDASMLA